MLLQITKIRTTIFILSLLLIFSFTASILATENSSTAKNIFLDSDQDGLSDAEEKTYGTNPNKADTDGDGYSDGTEIRGGYDPLKPAPGDKIISEKALSITDSVNEKSLSEENLTEELSIKLATAMAEVDEDPENKNLTMGTITELIDSSITSQMSFDELPEIDIEAIKIKKQDYSKYSKEKREAKLAEDNQEYLSAISYLLVNSLPHKISEPEDIEGLTSEVNKQISKLSSISSTSSSLNYFKDISKKGGQALEALSSIAVPKDLLDTHVKGLQLLKYAISLDDSATIDHSDPIKSIVSLGKVQSLLLLAVDFTSEIDTKLKDLNISLSSIEI